MALGLPHVPRSATAASVGEWRGEGRGGEGISPSCTQGISREGKEGKEGEVPMSMEGKGQGAETEGENSYLLQGLKEVPSCCSNVMV